MHIGQRTQKITWQRVCKYGLLLCAMACCFFIVEAYAAEQMQNLGEVKAKTIGNVFGNVTKSYSGLGSLIIGISYISGIGFSIAAMFKFKQHKDNPTQIPVFTPFVLFLIGVGMIFLPTFVKPAGYTLFGSGAKSAGFMGTGQQLPGE